MMQSISSAIAGIFFFLLLLGICWVWFLKPLLRTLILAMRDVATSSKQTFSLGVSIGNKFIQSSKEKIIEPEGEVTEGAVLLDKVAAPNYQIAEWVKGYPVKKLGYLLLRGYSNHLERCLVIEGNASLQRKHGRRIQLPNLEGNYQIGDKLVVEKSIEEASKYLETSVSKIESKTPEPKAVAVKEPAIVPSPVKTSPSEVKKPKALETYKGYLISYGKAVRHISASKDDEGDGSENGREITQFRVLIKGDDGVEESIWGQDLLRAIKDANVVINDMVEIIKTGKRQIGNSWKNLYVVNKLA